MIVWHRFCKIKSKHFVSLHFIIENFKKIKCRRLFEILTIFQSKIVLHKILDSHFKNNLKIECQHYTNIVLFFFSNSKNLEKIFVWFQLLYVLIYHFVYKMVDLRLKASFKKVDPKI